MLASLGRLSRVLVPAALTLATAPAAAEAQLITETFSGGGLVMDGVVTAPYPVTITVATDRTIVEDVNVRLQGVTHPFADQIDALVVGPGGQNVMLLSDVGISENAFGTYHFDDEAAGAVPDSMEQGTYRPTNVDDGSSDAFPAPAPSSPFGSALSAFRHLNPNGTWSLYAVDDESGDSGGNIGGWRVALTARRPAIIGFGVQETTEGGPPIRIVFTRNAAGAPLHAGSWSFTTAAGSAQAGLDYSTVAATLDFAAGETEKVVEIPVIDDKIPEDPERFNVQNTAASGDALGGAAWHQLIRDNDPQAEKPRVAPSAAQRVLRQRYVGVAATSNVAGSLAARGTISVPNAARVVRLKAAKRNVTAGKRARLQLRLSRRALAQVRRGLARGRRLKARIVVTATDLGGNTASRSVIVRLRR